MLGNVEDKQYGVGYGPVPRKKIDADDGQEGRTKEGGNHCHAHVEQGACAHIHFHTNTQNVHFTELGLVYSQKERLMEGAMRATSIIIKSLVSEIKIERRKKIPDRVRKRGHTDK